LNEDGAPFDSGFDDTGPIRVSAESGAVSLESALRDFGPAAIDDLIPRIRALAASLDAAHRAGVVHGALHPSKVFVTDDATSLVAGKGAHAPYAAPEVLGGHGATPKSDQYSLAAIAYEWLFGRPLSHHGDRPIEFRAMPGVDRVALSRALSRALSSRPEDRFASCVAFVDAVAGAIVPELPLLADVDDFAAEDELAPSASARPESDELRRDTPVVVPVELLAVDQAASFDAERDDARVAQDKPNPDDVAMVAEAFDSEPDDALLVQDQPNPDDVKIVAEPFDSKREGAFDEVDPRLSDAPPVAVPAWNPSAAATPAPRTMETPSFGPIALFLALIVGAVFGFAAGYMAKPRALQSGAPQEITVARPTDQPVASEKSDASEARDASDARDPSEKRGKPPVSKTAERSSASPASPVSPVSPAKVGRLLVRSTPSGASVSVDGVAKGVTPLALRDLDAGTRSVTIARSGYIPETRRILITKARPARTLEVRLASASAAETVSPKPSGGGGPRPGIPASPGKPAVTTGTLAVESRPAGAAVTINGKASGSTPLTINDLAPGDYQIVMTMPGYRNFATTVRVVAGERARAAASLTAVEQE
jgi:hypothetical protein